MRSAAILPLIVSGIEDHKTLGLLSLLVRQYSLNDTSSALDAAAYAKR